MEIDWIGATTNLVISIILYGVLVSYQRAIDKIKDSEFKIEDADKKIKESESRIENANKKIKESAKKIKDAEKKINPKSFIWDYINSSRAKYNYSSRIGFQNDDLRFSEEEKWYEDNFGDMFVELRELLHMEFPKMSRIEIDDIILESLPFSAEYLGNTEED